MSYLILRVMIKKWLRALVHVVLNTSRTKLFSNHRLETAYIYIYNTSVKSLTGLSGLDNIGSSGTFKDWLAERALPNQRIPSDPVFLRYNYYHDYN